MNYNHVILLFYGLPQFGDNFGVARTVFTMPQLMKFDAWG